MRRIKDVLVHPTAFFRTHAKDTLTDGLIYLAVLSSIYTIILLLTKNLFSGSLISFHFRLLNIDITNPIFYLPLFLIIIIVNVISVFLWCSLVHLSALILNGKGDYHQTFNTIVYSLTPVLLFGWIPFVSWLAMLHHVYIFVKGISMWHKVSHAKAIFTYLGPMLIIFLIAIIFTLLGLSLLYGIFQVKLPGF